MDAGLIEKARPLFAQGLSINAVAAELGTYFEKAKKLKAEIEGGSPPAKKKQARRGPKLKKDLPPPEPEDPESFDLTIQAPTERLDAIMAGFTAQEKANAIATVLQQRVDALIE